MTSLDTDGSAGARRAPLSAIVLTFNEEKNIGPCLHHLRDWVAELFVVDSGSTDRTVEIARELGATILQNPFTHYGAQRNWALNNCPITAPWTLHVDADERVTPELQASIRRVLAVEQQEVVGYLVSRRTIFLGRWIRHGGHYPAWHMRLHRTGRGRCEERLYDQHFYCDGPVRHLPGDLTDTLTPNITVFSLRHVRWAQLEADEQEQAASASAASTRIQGRIEKGASAIEHRRWLRDRYGRLPLFIRPFLYWSYRYFIRLGFLDGTQGLIFHFLQGFWYRFLVDSLLYERRRNRAEDRHET